MSSKTLVAVLVATTMLAGGTAFADQQGSNQQSSDQQSTTPPPGHAAVVKDFNKLSADGVRAYQDLTLARLAIFDGRTADAKKYVDDADTGFNKAKSDESVFNKAEATMRTHMSQNNGRSSSNGQTANDGANGNSDAGAQHASNGQKAGSSDGNTGSQNASDGNGNDVNKPMAWLPVNGAITIDEDFSANPGKAKAVQDANKSLAQGDKKGAMEKLKLAHVDLAVTLAVVPLQQTIDDVNQAKQLVDAGKFFEGSQKLRAVQNATVFTVADMAGTPTDKGSQQNAPSSH